MLSPDLLQHLLNLSAKTGDRLIIVNPTSAQTCVLMSLKDYEAFAVPKKIPSPSELREEGEGKGEGGSQRARRIAAKPLDQVNADFASAAEPTAEPIIEVMAPPPAPMIPEDEAQKFYFEPV